MPTETTIYRSNVSPNYYIQQTDTSTGSVTINTMSQYEAMQGALTFQVKGQTGIAPQLYFKYIKRKFKVLERMKLDSRLKKIEKAFYEAAENGQEVLSQKFMNMMAKETRESAIYAKGIKMFIEREDLYKHKRNLRDGHISDTMFKDFTRVIPKDVLKKKKAVEDVFDDFVIFHYWNEKAQKDTKNMNAEEKAKMRDPVLFGIIRETDRLYFIADWEDEYCDLTFEEIVDVLGKDDEDITIPRSPSLSV